MRTSRVRHLIAYGTLMSTCDAELGRAERALIQKHGRLLGSVSFNGRLYDAGACPAAIRDPNVKSRVFAQLWKVEGRLPRVLNALDVYEGFTPDAPLTSLYVRRAVRVGTPDGRRVSAWIYEWNGSASGLVDIPTGRWIAPSISRARSSTNCVRALALAERT